MGALDLFDADVVSISNLKDSDKYERNTEGDLITNRQSLRCYVEEMHPDCLLLRFSHPQHGTLALHFESRYAIEPAHSDSIFSSLYRGLFALLTCPRRRRDLILGLRKPESDASTSLINPIDSKEVEGILKSTIQSLDYYLLVGPPGSGKTNIALRSMVEELLAQNPSDNLLLMAYTNRAVDEICQMLEGISPEPDYLRVGQELACGISYRPRLVRNVIASCRNRREIIARLNPVRIVCGTVASLSGATELFKLKRFRTGILDEASQVLEPQLLPLLTQTTADGQMAIGRFVFIGDHKQLPAVVVQHQSHSHVESPILNGMGLLDCRDSLFERLHRGSPKEFVGMLTHQGRMHREISDFVCRRYYDSLLGLVPLPHQTEALCWKAYAFDNKTEGLLATRRMAYIDVVPERRESNNKVNPDEAQVVASLVRSLYDLTRKNGQAWSPAQQVGIIVPFRGQIAMVRQALRERQVPDSDSITTDTVERYQGSQRDVIIFSTVVRQHYQLQILSNPVESNGQPIDRKLNVAITRARKQFFLVGNVRLLRQANDYRSLIEYMGEIGM